MDQSNALGDMLASLLQNPEIMKTVSSIAANAENSAATSATAEKPPAESPAEGGEGFSIPPELLAKLPQVMSALSSNLALPQKTGEGEKSPKDPVPDATAAKRKELLRSLKPFLSEKRCSMIDGLLSIEGLWGILSAFSDK